MRKYPLHEHSSSSSRSNNDDGGDDDDEHEKRREVTLVEAEVENDSCAKTLFFLQRFCKKATIIDISHEKTRIPETKVYKLWTCLPFLFFMCIDDDDQPSVTVFSMLQRYLPCLYHNRWSLGCSSCFLFKTALIMDQSRYFFDCLHPVSRSDTLLVFETLPSILPDK